MIIIIYLLSFSQCPNVRAAFNHIHEQKRLIFRSTYTTWQLFDIYGIAFNNYYYEWRLSMWFFFCPFILAQLTIVICFLFLFQHSFRFFSELPVPCLYARSPACFSLIYTLHTAHSTQHNVMGEKNYLIIACATEIISWQSNTKKWRELYLISSFQ